MKVILEIRIVKRMIMEIGSKGRQRKNNRKYTLRKLFNFNKILGIRNPRNF